MADFESRLSDLEAENLLLREAVSSLIQKAEHLDKLPVLSEYVQVISDQADRAEASLVVHALALGIVIAQLAAGSPDVHSTLESVLADLEGTTMQGWESKFPGSMQHEEALKVLEWIGTNARIRVPSPGD
ncbi:MAG: hypothetical protein V4808_01770 [Pseudomonadota bacterium]